jgi:hypothetical protein
MILGSKPRNSEFVHWNSVLVSVIPAEAEIQAILEPESKTNLDAGRSFILREIEGPA